MTVPPAPPNAPQKKKQKLDTADKGLIALVLAVVATGLAWLMVQHMMDASKLQDCMMSGRKNCAQIDEQELKSTP